MNLENTWYVIERKNRYEVVSHSSLSELAAEHTAVEPSSHMSLPKGALTGDGFWHDMFTEGVLNVAGAVEVRFGNDHPVDHRKVLGNILEYKSLIPIVG
jgi:hypothetical protein